MSVATRQALQVAEQAQKKNNLNVDRRASIAVLENITPASRVAGTIGKPRVFVAAENRLLREALSRMLIKNGEIEVVGMDSAEPFRVQDLLQEDTDILLMSSRGNRNEDLTAVRAVRTIAPKVQILLIGVNGEEAEFLQCVRAGVRGYLPRDAPAEDVVEGVRALQSGEAICPGTLCASLFRYMEREASYRVRSSLLAKVPAANNGASPSSIYPKWPSRLPHHPTRAGEGPCSHLSRTCATRFACCLKALSLPSLRC